jgi:AcrR family transcriptional regulator
LADRRADEAAQRRAELLEATRRVVLERGLGNVRIADVAAAGNVSGGLVHYHFSSKDALLVEMLRTVAQRDIERVQAIAADGGSATGRLDRILRHYVPSGPDDEGWRLWVDLWAASLRNPALQGVRRELDDAWDDVLNGVITEGAETGEFSCDDPGAAAERLSALLDGLCARGTLHDKTMSRRKLLAHARAATAAELGVDHGELALAGTTDAPSRRAAADASAAPGGTAASRP